MTRLDGYYFVTLSNLAVELMVFWACLTNFTQQAVPRCSLPAAAGMLQIIFVKTGILSSYQPDIYSVTVTRTVSRFVQQ